MESGALTGEIWGTREAALKGEPVEVRLANWYPALAAKQARSD